MNGQEVLTLILGHLLADLNSFGTIETPVGASMGVGEDRNRSLKQSARMVTNAIMAHAEKDGFDTVSAVKQWRCLRHLTAIVDAVVTKSGYVLLREKSMLCTDGQVSPGEFLNLGSGSLTFLTIVINMLRRWTYFQEVFTELGCLNLL